MTAPRAHFSWCLVLLLTVPAWGQYAWLNSTEPFTGNPAWPQSTQAPPSNYFNESPPSDYFDNTVWEDIQSERSDENFNMTVTVDGLILGRSKLRSVTIGVDEFQQPVYSTDDINLSAKVGPRFSLMMGGRLTGLEFSFFGFNAFQKQDYLGPDITPLFFGGIPVNTTDTFDVFYGSRLYSAELMFWQPVLNAARFGIGVRGVGLNEEFEFTHLVGQTTMGFWSDVNNDLVGLQLGAGVPLLRRPHFFVDATAKTGIYHHSTDVVLVSQNFLFDGNDSDATAVTELNVGGEYHVGDHVSFRGGYMALWLHDVFLGPNQNDSINIITGTGQLDSSTAVYQGGYFGFQVRW